MQDEWVQGKVLATGNLHYYLEEGMYRKIRMKIEILNRAVSFSLNYSNRTFIASLGTPFETFWLHP